MAVGTDGGADVHPVQQLTAHEVAQDVGIVGQDDVGGGGEGVLRQAGLRGHALEFCSTKVAPRIRAWE